MVFFCPILSDPPGASGQDPSRRENALHSCRATAKSAKGRSAPLCREIGCGETVAELGVTNLAITRGFDHGPSVGIGEHGLEHERVQAVAAATRMEGAENGRARKGEVADRIERLVAHELVAITQAFAVDDAVVANGDGILQRGAEREASSPQPLHVLHEAERPSARELAAEGTGIYVDLDPLGADQGGVEVDLDIEVEAVMGCKLAEGAILLDTDRLQYFQETARRFELGKADFVDRLDEARCAAVHDRHFAAIDLDQGVIDAETAQSGEQVLDRGDRGAVAVAE